MNARGDAPALSREQVETFWCDGFLVVDDVFLPDDIRALRQAVESPAISQQFQGLDYTKHMLGLTEIDPIFLNLARDSRIIHRLAALIGPDIQLQHSKLAAKPLAKGAGPFGWHQDYAYFPHTNTDLAAVMVMLDDSTPENGCMSMVRGSHKLGLLDHNDANGFFSGACVESKHWEQQPEKVMPITPRAGGISIHHCLTLHGSPANLSGKPRRGLVFQYRAADAYQLADTVWSDTGLIVSGQNRADVRCTAGSIRLPKFNRWGRAGHGTAWQQLGDFARRINEQSGHWTPGTDEPST